MSVRFNRQEILGEIGVKGQEKLGKSCVAIVGIGGLGSVSAELLCRAGVGKLIVIDPDKVHESNLPRQLLYGSSDIGKKKVNVAAARLKKIWPDIIIEKHGVFLDGNNINIMDGADVILDGTDNLPTRFIISEFAKEKKKLFIYAGAIKTKGMVYACQPSAGSPSLKDILKGKRTADACGSVGIINGANVMVATLQTMLAMRWILGNDLDDVLYLVDAWDLSVEKIAAGQRNSRKR